MIQPAAFDALLGPKVTLEEWGALPEAVPGEFVEGRLVEEEMPDLLHEVIVMWLGHVFLSWAEKSSAIVGGSEVKFAVSRDRGRKPDVTVFLAGTKRPPKRGVVRVPPDVAIEVISQSRRDERRDREEKLGEYAAFGIRWYWIIDPERRSVEIHTLGEDGSYTLAIERHTGRIEEVPGCPGLVLDLDVLWSKADVLSDEASEE
jgi:Uma2 family endonuclease